jgi:hypothetical protein
MARSVSDIEYQALEELGVCEEVDNIIRSTQPTQADAEEEETFDSQPGPLLPLIPKVELW